MRVEIGVAWPSKKLAERTLKRKRREMSPGLWMVVFEEDNGIDREAFPEL